MRELLSLAVRCGATPKTPALLWADRLEPLFQRLEPLQRVKVLAALMVLLTAAAFLFVVVRAGGRIARWYIGDPPRHLESPDANDRKWQRKPRVSSRERDQWRKTQ